MKTEFFKECYDFELTLREQLATALSTPLTGVSVLGGVLVFLIQNFPFRNELLTWRIADGAGLKKWYDQLLLFYGGNEAHADAEFDKGLIDRYNEATAVNAQNNLTKVAYIARANRAVAYAAAFALAASVPYFVAFAVKPEQPAKVQIEQPVKVQIAK